MIIVGIYSFNCGEEIIRSKYSAELAEVEKVIAAVNSIQCKMKISREKTMLGRTLYSPQALNRAFTKEFGLHDWKKHKVECEYPTKYYVPGFVPNSTLKRSFREMDFVKNRMGVEVQFGKYAFMVYNVCAKMTIFHKLGVIDVGIEIVPIKLFAEEMSTGVSYFEQFVWDLEQRGIANIDIPVLVLGYQNSNKRLTEKITLRYFQHLAALYTEIILVRLFNHQAKFLADLNGFVATRNANRLPDEPQDEVFTADDLTKLAHWIATGSGKTPILHLNYHQFLHYNYEPLDNILLITPNEGLSE